MTIAITPESNTSHNQLLPPVGSRIKVEGTVGTGDGSGAGADVVEVPGVGSTTGSGGDETGACEGSGVGGMGAGSGSGSSGVGSGGTTGEGGV